MIIICWSLFLFVKLENEKKSVMISIWYNAHFEAKKAEALQLLNEKHFTGKTNKEIAEILGLKKEQIDNLAKQMKKSLKCATRKES